nr:sulfatase [Allomuricauda sp.]
MKRYLTILIVICFCSCKNNEKKENLETEEDIKNVLLIVVDDLGWADVGVYGSSFYETPNIDALAKEGILFSNGYASCPVCSPSRASIQTGLYPTNVDVTDWIPGRGRNKGAEPENRWLANEFASELALPYETIAESLKKNGYKTFFAGKWHLGENEDHWPENQGFEINKGGFNMGRPDRNKKKGINGYFSPYGNPRLEDGPEGEYLTDRLANETIAFLEDNKDANFFINLSFYQVHTPLQAKEEAIEKYRKKRKTVLKDTLNELDFDPRWKEGHFKGNSFKERFVQAHPTYAAMVESMDENVGRVLKKLKELGLYDNTLIVFTSDNGGLSTSEGSPTSNLPLRAGKGWLYEGGIRVPFIIKDFNQKAAGSKSIIPVSGIDIFPTIVDAVGIRKISTDGRNILQQEVPERSLFWHYPHYSNQGGHPGSVIRKGNYKLIHDFETGKKMLFNLDDDLGETRDLSKEEPELVQGLYKELQAWRGKNNATMMRPNPGWDKKESIVE